MKKVLQSIKNQTYHNIEVLVVDRPSEDGTKELVEIFGYKYLALTSERTRAVNYAAQHSNGDYIYYIGSDYVLEKDLLQTVVKVVLKNKVDAAIIANVIKPTGFWSRVRQFEKELYLGDRMIEATRFFSRRAFFDVGGYDEAMVAYEEHDLHNRLLKQGYQIARVNGVKEINIGEPNSLHVYAVKYYYYGKTIGKYLAKYPQKSVIQLTIIRPAYIRHWRKMIQNPLLTLGIIVYQITRYISAILGYLVNAF